MKYSSLHTYLENHFAHVDMVTDAMVKEAKAMYRKEYLTQYQKRYQQKHIQITFRISKKQYLVFSNLAQDKGIKVTTLIKQLALQKRTSNDSNIFKLHVLELIDVIEEAIEHKMTLDLEMVLQHVETLEKKLQ